MNVVQPITSPVTVHKDLAQGTDEWLEARKGILTASTMNLIVTPKTLKAASNKDVRLHLYELVAQRVNEFVEPVYTSAAMERGHTDEAWAKHYYGKQVNPVTEAGFITNNRYGFTLGYSPDGLVGDDGLIEVKSRNQKHQIKTYAENAAKQMVPDDFMLQCQAGLLISEREWLDFVSYSNGMPMLIIRVYPDGKVSDAILEAAEEFEKQAKKLEHEYREMIEGTKVRTVETEYHEHVEIETEW